MCGSKRIGEAASVYLVGAQGSVRSLRPNPCLQVIYIHHQGHHIVGGVPDKQGIFAVVGHEIGHRCVG